MRETDLPSPGRFNSSYHVRRTIVHAISSLQVSKRTDGTHPAADNFSAFLVAAKEAVDLMVAAPPEPVNTVAPAITGTAQVGQTLTTTNGTWTNTPTSYTRQWYVDNVPAGTGGLTYSVRNTDIGKVIRVVVRAINKSGNAEKASAPTVKVIA